MLRTTKRFARALVLLGIIIPLSGFVSVEALFAPKPELWQHWEAHDAQSQDTIDHGRWDAFLTGYVTTDEAGLNRFDYGAVTADDRWQLASYIEGLTQISIGAYNRAEQRAFWINLYNALTVQLILEHYPVTTIRDIDISPGLFSDGPWGKPLVAIEGEPVSLNDIEHRILRPIWDDARIHYAVNCASVGCPNLQTRAFTAKNSESLLEAAAVDYINTPRAVRLQDGKLIVSSIYVWFSEDFGGNDAAIIAHLKRYARDDLADALMSSKAIADHGYLWDLNDQES